MEKFAQIETKVNEIAISFGFREFGFNAEKYETAQRALSRFVKAMNNKVARNEVEDTTDIKIKLDLVSSLIKRVNVVKFSEEKTEESLDFILENSSEQLFDHHKNKLVKYFSLKLPKEVKFNYTILKSYYAYQTFCANEEGAKALLDKLRDSNKEIFDKIKLLEETTAENLETKLVIKDELTKKFAELFNTALLETALTVCKLNKDKIDEINKTQLAKKAKPVKSEKRQAKPKVKKRIDMNKVKTNTVKTAYTDKGAENNAFASLLAKK
jgi:hypothetical protein